MVKRLEEHVDTKRIVAAIEAAERSTTGHIRVSLSHHFRSSARKMAERAFVKLGLHKAPARNGVLIFVVPSRREFVILGDAAIHEKVGQEFWDRVSAAISDRIRAGDLTSGLVHGVEEAGRELAAHFPAPVRGQA